MRVSKGYFRRRRCCPEVLHLKTKRLAEKWEVKRNGGSEWAKAIFVDGDMEVLMNKAWVKKGVLETKVTEKQFIKSPIAKVQPQGFEENCSKVKR